MRVRAKAEVNARVLDEFNNQNLTPGKTYLVVGYDDRYYRALDDRADPILYPRYLFEVVEPKHPEDWIKTEESDGTYFVDPPECSTPGFYEDFHDGKPDAKDVFRSVVERLEIWEQQRSQTD